MGRTACTEPQCLYCIAIPLLPLWTVRPVQSLSACGVELYFYSPYEPYGLYRASVPVQGWPLPSLWPLHFFTCCTLAIEFWHVYVLDLGYFVWSWSPHRHLTFRDVTPWPLTVTDTCIMYHLTNFEVSWNVILHMPYVSTCVGARVKGGKETTNKCYPLWSMLLQYRGKRASCYKYGWYRHWCR
jgi:hypothetical protein